MSRRIIGRYIVADDAICHGQPTFRGTRILVADILDMVREGRDWEGISEDWDGKVSKEAIAEAVWLAGQAFLAHIEEFVVETVPT